MFPKSRSKHNAVKYNVESPYFQLTLQAFLLYIQGHLYWKNHGEYKNWWKIVKIMSILKSFCFCFSPKTGSVVLGCMGIVFAVLMIVPPCLILDNHNFYFNEYIRQQKSYAGKTFLFTLKVVIIIDYVVMFCNISLWKNESCKSSFH